MTRVRRINVSQIEGNTANDNEGTDIRPFGDIGVYVDDSGNTDKLVLLMFDGTRTNLKSKVLQPGILYGSNADSGDGNNYDTIKLIPDSVLHRADGAYSNDQYLVVDPTDGEPGHIHLRAGGTIDNSLADLYLGGELTNVRVSDTADTVRIRTTNIGDPNITMDWTFDSSGDLTFPGSSNARIGESEPGLVVRSDAGFAVVTNANSLSNYEVEFVGYISDGFANDPGATLTVTEIIVGTITNGMTVYGAGLPSEGWTVTVGTLPNAGSGGVGNYELSGANILTSVQSFNNGVAALGSQPWLFGTNGNLTLPAGGDILDSNGTSVLGSGGGDATGVSRSDDNLIIRLTDANAEGLELRSIVVDGNDLNVSSTVLGANGFVISTNSNVSQKQWQFDNNGEIVLPSGGVIRETVVTDNPTIELEPAAADAASQKLIIKGGGGGYPNIQNNINVNLDAITVATGGTLNVYVYSTNPNLDNVTAYWWVAAEESAAVTVDSGTVEIAPGGFGSFQIQVADDTVRFRVYVGTVASTINSDTGVSLYVNTPESFDASWHLHLTTGDLTETSIFLGTDNHNVRTKANGDIEITSRDYLANTSYVWKFGSNGVLTLPFEGGIRSIDDTIVLKSYDTTFDVSKGIRIGSNGALYFELGDDPAYFQIEETAGDTSLIASAGLNIVASGPSNAKTWEFGTDGSITLPASGDIVDSTSVSQLAKRVEGSWAVTTGTNTYSFTVPSDGTYVMWAKGNIPNGIITWNATVSVSNTNVPAIGTQYAWNYTGGGSPILLTSIPDQIKGVAGTISTDATYAGTTSNRFDFGISNTSGSTQTVYYGYTKIS